MPVCQRGIQAKKCTILNWCGVTMDSKWICTQELAKIPSKQMCGTDQKAIENLWFKLLLLYGGHTR